MREKYEALIASVPLVKENDVQTEKAEFTVAQRQVTGEIRHASVTNSSPKISGLNYKDLILTCIKFFTSPVCLLGGCPLDMISTVQVILVAWHCDIDICFHAVDEGMEDLTQLLNVSTQK